MLKLILTMGYPHTGKTTWSRNSGHVVVCMDSLRKRLTNTAGKIPTAEPMVLATARLFVECLFDSGQETVVIDYLNLRRSDRDFWIGPWDRQVKRFGGLELTDLYLKRLQARLGKPRGQKEHARWMGLWQDVEPEEGFIALP